MINIALWWLGLMTFCAAAMWGLLEGGLFVLDRVLKLFGIWNQVFHVMGRMFREKRNKIEPPAN
jgi:hypothetical protein